MKTYRAPRSSGRGEIREKGSRFLGVLLPVTSEGAATAALDAVRREFPSATHHCFAWRIGRRAVERSSDDGEPSGTAGQPILRVLRGGDRSDVLVVVVRWYGGTKLGKGGLARAYAAAARQAAEAVAWTVRAPTVGGCVTVGYQQIGVLKRLVNPPLVSLVGEDYGVRVRLTLRIREDQLDSFEAALADLGATFEVATEN
ncbi:MAG: YigZ family protein [Acidobacteriota bacterium]